ncbi:MAG TPA: hypothetical protein VFK32_09335 [Tepidiformaceae bacterium]|nr:hypothetical protein [Tepidiformaceae bacterium]
MIKRLGLALLIVMSLPALAEAQSGRGKGKEAGKSAAAKADARGSDVEIRIIREYYGEPSRKLKPLPPGMYKNLGRGKPVPPGILRTRFPELLEARMPRREGASWWIAGDQVLLVDSNNRIVDFFRALR